MLLRLIAWARHSRHGPRVLQSRALSDTDSFRHFEVSCSSLEDVQRFLTSCEPDVAVRVLISALEPEGFRAVTAALVLGRLGSERAVKPLARLLASEGRFWVERGAAAIALGELGPKAVAALPELRSALSNATKADESWDERAREAVEDAIARIERPGTPSQLTGKGARFEMWGIW